MTGKEVSLMEMLDARELRVHRQLSLQGEICFCSDLLYYEYCRTGQK